MNKLFLISFNLLFISFSYSQTSTWYFGDKAGLKFNAGIPSPLSGSTMTTIEGSTVVTDKQNNVIFYADGQSIWNGSTNALVTNQLLGGSSSTQASLIVPVPTFNCGKFLVFTTPGIEIASFSNGLGVCLVDVAGTP